MSWIWTSFWSLDMSEHCLLVQRLPQRRQWSPKRRTVRLWKVCFGPWRSRKYHAIGFWSNYSIIQPSFLCSNPELLWNSYSEISTNITFDIINFKPYIPLDKKCFKYVSSVSTEASGLKKQEEKVSSAATASPRSAKRLRGYFSSKPRMLCSSLEGWVCGLISPLFNVATKHLI